MLQVPMFGMENNPDSLEGRRRAYATAYGYTPFEIEYELDQITEVIGHVPHIDPHEWPQLLAMIPDGEVVLEFWSGVVPYARMWVTTHNRTESLEKASEFEKGALWILEDVRKVSPMKQTQSTRRSKK